jgi:hypothetical protein
MAGPLLSEAGAMIGSLLLVEAASLDEARALQAEDPYVKGGVFDLVTIYETRWAIGEGKRA